MLASLNIRSDMWKWKQGRNALIDRVFEGVLREYRHHSNPANHRPIDVQPIEDPLKRTLVSFAGVGALGLAGIGAITPIMPTWPFALVALFCFARSSRRVRAWVVNNHAIKSVMSLVYSRPERPFAWARMWLDRLTGRS